MRCVALAVALVGVVSPAAGQRVEALVAVSAATDRVAGVLPTSGRAAGYGAATTIEATLGAWGVTVDGSIAWLSREDAGAGQPRIRPAGAAPVGVWTAREIGVAVRYSVWRPLSVEVSGTRQILDPDINGEEVAYLATGLRGNIPLSSQARLVGHVRYIVAGRFSGTGALGFAAETGMAFHLRLTDRYHAVASYDFRRIDRRLPDPTTQSTVTSRIERDVARLGVTIRLRE